MWSCLESHYRRIDKKINKNYIIYFVFFSKFNSSRIRACLNYDTLWAFIAGFNLFVYICAKLEPLAILGRKVLLQLWAWSYGLYLHNELFFIKIPIQISSHIQLDMHTFIYAIIKS